MCSHNCVEINDKLKWPMQDKERQILYIAGNLFHQKIHCAPSFDHRSHFDLELEAVKEARKMQGPWLRGHRWHQNWWHSTSMTQH